MGDRVSWIDHKGVKILYADYSGTFEEEFIQTVAEFKSILRKQAPGSVVTLTNVTDTVVTRAVKDKLKEMAEETKGISPAAAAIGITGFKKSIAMLLRSDLKYLDTLEEAKDWLAEQAIKQTTKS